ncbi:MAG: hypothetical protein A2189_09170 [Paenibacillus sp. RIFOXYA1_FULL_44_5]|nr:MAG: hypothetical protein A2189_09170 [Paenibacillus sp. RIFOXYA1_FULL_44_5]
MFVQDRWFVILIVLVVLFVVIKIVKAVVKWVIVLAILAALIWYGASYKGQIQTVGKTVYESIQHEAIKQMAANHMTYANNQDGTFSITADGISLTGKPDSDVVSVTFKGYTFSLNRDKFINDIIAQAQKQK